MTSLTFTPYNDSNHNLKGFQWSSATSKNWARTYSVKVEAITELPDDPGAADAYELPINPDGSLTIYIEPEGPAYIDSNVPGGTGEVLCGLEIEEWKH